MIVEDQVTINGSKAAVWAAVSNIENAPAIISGIMKVEVVEKPASGLVGFRWRETRMLFGKPTTVEMWITDAAENEFYKARAEENGFVFVTTMTISDSGGGVTLTSTHETRPQGIVARLKAIPMFLFRGVIRKCIKEDLNGVKAAVEKERSVAA